MAHPGNVLYLTASIVAGLIAIWVAWGCLDGAEKGDPVIQVVPLLIAGAIWLLAKLGRDFLAER